MKKNNEKGGAALEYLVVTLFALLISITLLSFCGKIISQKINKAFVSLGVDPIEVDLSFLNSNN